MPEAAAALYIYDETLLLRQTIRVYLNVSAASNATLRLSTTDTYYDYNLDTSSEWIYADFPMSQGCTTLRIAIQAMSGETIVSTYSVE